MGTRFLEPFTSLEAKALSATQKKLFTVTGHQLKSLLPSKADWVLHGFNIKEQRVKET